jgi:hypothetical protein
VNGSSDGPLPVVDRMPSGWSTSPGTASDDHLFLVLGPDVAAGGADVGAGPAITPTAAGWRSAHHAVAPSECASLPKGIGMRGPGT